MPEPGPVNIRIRFRGRGRLKQFGIGLPKPEIVQTVHIYGVGEEIERIRPGWFVHEVLVEQGMVTWVVELVPPRT